MLTKPEVREVTLALARPNRIALRTPSFNVVSNGATLWQQFGPLEQYVETKAPKELDLAGLQLNMFFLFDELKHPWPSPHTADDWPTLLFGNIVQLKGTGPNPCPANPAGGQRRDHL